jgi:hypothetical protein
MIFTPRLQAPSQISNAYIWQELLHLTNFILPGQVIEKIVIFAVLLLCGIGMHRLINTSNIWPKYLAGIFYMINPFTYERWISGQYLVIGGYALLPFLVKSILSFCIKPETKKATPVLLWYSAIAIASLQDLALGIILGTTIFIAYLLAYRSEETQYRRHMWQVAGIVIGGIIILNSYWLIGISNGHSPIAHTIDSIGNVDLKAFTTASNPHAGLFFNVLSMYGFWLERYGRYAMPNHNLFVWFIGFAIIAVLVSAGIWSQRKQRSLQALCLGICGIIGLIMALGIYAPITGSITRWIITHLPFMRGFREPEKFSALLVLAYAYFMAYGLDLLLTKIRNKGALELAHDGALLLPLLYVSTMPFGFANQLKPVNYPPSWYSFNQQLLKHPATGIILFLPWHEYMSYDFTTRIIANPAPAFFYNSKVIAGTDAEFGGLNDPHPTAISQFIEERVLAHTNSKNLGSALAKINVEYVLLARGYDYDKYGWLQHQTDLKLISNRPGLEVFLNEAYHHG